MRNPRVPGILAILAAALAPVPAFAAEPLATFTVPLSLHLVNQSVQAVRVSCWLQQKNPVTGHVDQYGQFNPGPWINGEADNGNSVSRDVKPDANGDFEGTVTLTLHKNIEPGQLIGAQCGLSLVVDGQAYTIQPASNASAAIAIKAAPGTSFVDRVNKPF